ncbi:MAG: Uma2 family endonuclease [Gemmataceae bacterium]|nr:Uma2 family endonuclease [Gemmataceae bacterium]
MTALLTPPAPVAEEVSAPAEMLLTEADLALMPRELSRGTVQYELHHGKLVVMPPPGDIHSIVTGNLAYELRVQGQMRGHGQYRGGEVGILLGRDPDHVLVPETVFISNARLPVRRTTEGYLETMPDLIVEVRSKNDTLAYTARKAGEYLAGGAVLVWVVDPIGRRVFAHRAGAEPVEIDEDGVLTCDDIIPGFAVSVRAALAEP